MTQNLLGNETSPYLLQHKDNPVHWRPWGDAALAEAKQANKPILLSVGYAACHWCHVMAHESFEDDGVAAVMNQGFVNIKVDREERPDVDTIYMSALQMLGEQGGWPLTMFLTPSGEPFWGGTYFPKEPRFGRPGFVDLLNEVSRIFREEPEKVDQNRTALLERLQAASAPASPDDMSPDLPDAAAERLLSVTDSVNGGLQGAPKFPQTGVLELLWRAGERPGDARYSDAALLALTRMCQGGIYDHLGGGFARYTVDATWLVPHFEKMLYDNALILDLLVHGWQATRDPLFASRVEETIGWLAREMRTGEGGFASSLDADSDGEEGKFYVWTAEEIREVLGEDGFALFADAYDVTQGGNWEGKTILNRLRDPALRDPDTEARLAAMRATLLERRAARVRPGLDDKVLVDWNGLMIHALARAGFAFSRPDWIDLAIGAFDFVAESMTENGRLLHSYRAGQAAQKGMLSDYANMSRAALGLFEVTGRRANLERAEAWSAVLDRHFLAPDGSYYMTADDASDLIVRPRSGIDDATPNGNAVSAANQLRLWHLTGESCWRERAEAIFAAYAADIRRNVFGFATMLNAYDFALRPLELVLAAPAGTTADGLVDTARNTAAFNLLLSQVADGADLPAGHPAHGKGTVDGKPAAYVCTQAGCSLPVTEPEALTRAIETARSG